MEKKIDDASGCAQIREAFVDWVDGQLSPSMEAMMLGHLRGCPQCSSDWREYQFVVSALRSMETERAPDGVFESVRDRIHRPAFWKSVFGWIMATPTRKAFAPAAACIAMIITGLALWFSMERPSWEQPAIKGFPETPPSINVPGTLASSAHDAPVWATGLSAPINVAPKRILPAMDELLNPFRALIEEGERRFSSGAVWREDLILDTSGSEEVFERIKVLVKELKGQMFVMGIRHLGSGRVIRSRVVIRIAMGKSQRLLKGLERLGKVYHLFPERDEKILPPDRLQISVLSVAQLKGTHPSALEASAPAH